jgi:hypothetical protein
VAAAGVRAPFGTSLNRQTPLLLLLLLLLLLPLQLLPTGLQAAGSRLRQTGHISAARSSRLWAQRASDRMRSLAAATAATAQRYQQLQRQQLVQHMYAVLAEAAVMVAAAQAASAPLPHHLLQLCHSCQAQGRG